MVPVASPPQAAGRFPVAGARGGRCPLSSPCRPVNGPATADPCRYAPRHAFM